MVESSPQLGNTVTGLVYAGFLTKNASVIVKSGTAEVTKTVTFRNLSAMDIDVGAQNKARIRDVLVTQGIHKTPAAIASPGDIVTLQLGNNVVPVVYDSIVGSSSVPLLPFRAIDPPLIGIDVRPNTSPYQGEDGTKVILERAV